jgi:RHS repeat-associated protein
VGTGLYHYGARYYDSAIGRFLQPDTVVPNVGDPQNLNRYSYTLNNPVKYRDPSGHWAETVWDVANIAWDIYEVKNDPSALNIGALVVDVGAAVLPFVPAGAGLIARGSKAAKAAVEVASHADEVVDAAKAVSKVEDVRHARSSAEVVQSVLRKIDPGRFNPGARFGKAFYVAQEGETAVAEIAAHGGEASHVIRYQVDLSKAKVLDLTNADIAKAWGYVEDAGAYSAHQDLARRAMEQGYNTIKYNSYRGPGFDYAFLDNPLNPFDFDEWLIPQMVSPVP